MYSAYKLNKQVTIYSLDEGARENVPGVRRVNLELTDNTVFIVAPYVETVALGLHSPNK